jgi:hypothetical protein
MTRELANELVFAGVIGALVLLFAAGLRVPLGDVGWRRWAGRVAVVAVAATVTLLANVALFGHDVHFDVTASHAFTPSADAERVVKALATDVELTYFYQKQNPAGRAAKTMVEILGRANPRLRVRTVDPDQHPGLASRYGVRVYNVAVLESGGRRLQVSSTEDRDIALGLLRVTRTAVKTICFAVGHGEYDVENMEYHTHFEGVQGHSHDAHGMGVVLTEQHGLGRLRRALDALGFAARKVTLATAGGVPADCAVLVEAGPRTRPAPPEIEALEAFLAAGGAALLLLEPGFAVDERLAAALARAGVRVDEGVVVDPLDHYFTDEQMVAVSRHAPHPITRGLALSFYPGIRPVEPVAAAGVQSVPLFASSAQSFTRPLAPGAASRPGVRTLAVAAEGVLGVRPFRLVVVGDVDFVSNSFFPYMSNSDLVMGMLAWLLREERAPTVRPAVEVLPTVTLTNAQVREIFLATVVALPGTVALAGGVVWWRRRR